MSRDADAFQLIREKIDELISYVALQGLERL